MTDTHPESWGDARSKTVEWHDPMVGAAAAMTMPGLDYLRAIGDGELPGAPIGQLIGMEWVEIAEGRVVFAVTPDESTYNPIGAVHGGLVCTLLDSVVGCALHTTLPAGKAYTSVEIKVSYLKGVSARSGRLTATGTVVKAGSRVGFAEGVVVDESGAIVATASSTLLIFDVRQS